MSPLETASAYAPAPRPFDDGDRVRALHALSVLDTPAEAAYDDLVRLAAFICDVPISFIGLVDQERLWMKAQRGLASREMPREIAFCGHTILQNDVFIISDTRADPRFAGHPMVVRDPEIRFYAGVPLRTTTGFNVGTLCVVDTLPRQLTPEQRDALIILGKQAATLLEMRRLVAELRRIAAAERQTATRLAAIYDAATEVAIIALGPDGMIASFNSGAEQMLGYSAPSLVERESALIFFDDEELRARAAALTEVFGRPFHGLDAILEYARQGTYDHREWTLRHRDGHKLVVDIVVTAMHDASGAISGFVAVAKDVTDRKRFEEARRESEEWFAVLADASPVGIFRTDPNGLSQYTNPRWREMTGLSLEESLGAGWARAIHPDDREFVFARRTEMMNRGADYELEFRFQRPDGQILLVRSRTRPLVDSRDQISGFVGIVEDVTAQRAAEAKVREGEQRVRAMLENMLGGMITIDANTIITSANPAAERMFGYTADELVGRSLAMLVPDSVGDKREYMRNARNKSLGKVTEWEGQRKDGKLFPFELSMFGFPTSRGVELAGNIRDISDRKAAEQAKKEFISTVSHELRTPLTSIRGSLRLLSSGTMGPLEPEARRMVDIAERNSARLLALINDLLDLERLESGRMTMQLAELSLDSILRRSAESLSGFAQQENVEIQVWSTLEVVRVDEYRLVQVIVNLLSNAVKFSPAGSTVDVEAKPAGEFVEVRVTDRGRGIPEEARQVIFERFQQVDASDSKAKGGAGLGLAISKAIVEQHGGSIGVESEEGRGSCFWFRVPRVLRNR